MTIHRLPDSHTVRAQLADLERKAEELAANQAPPIDTTEALRVAQYMADRHWDELVAAHERHIREASNSFWIGMALGLTAATIATVAITLMSLGG